MLVDGYLRVSRVGGRSGASFISPAVQREQIEAWAKLNGAVIGEVFEELDESGARADRPLLEAALERVERGESQGIVVAKLDRFGRSLVDGLAKIERLAASGGVFVSVQDGLDLSTPTGKLVLRIMFSMAEWELDRVRANWQEARARAIARGVHPGMAPLGYRRGSGGQLQVDRTAAPVIAEVFRRRADGATISSLVGLLNASGLKTQRGAPRFVESSVKGILANRAYRGEVRSGPHHNPAAHPQLVDEATWQEAQRPRRFHSNRRTSLLGGLLRCSSCRMKMSVEAGVFRHGVRGGTYRCPGQTSAGRCPAPARVRGEEIEGLVEEFVFRAAASPPDRRAGARVRRAEEALACAEASLVRYRDSSAALTALTPDRFAAGLAKRQADVEAAALGLAAARRAMQGPRRPSPGLQQDWPEMSTGERRTAIEELIDCVFVAAGTGPLPERAHVWGRGAAPADLPRRGVPLTEVRPFDPAAERGWVRLRPPRRWSQRRLEVELRAWGAQRTTWPSYPEFVDAGRAALYLRLLDWGGPHFWARRLGWSRPPRITVWSDAVIRGALRPLLTGREIWPSAAEFDAAGLGPARRAAIRHGGISRWASLFGVAMRPRNSMPRSDAV